MYLVKYNDERNEAHIISSFLSKVVDVRIVTCILNWIFYFYPETVDSFETRCLLLHTLYIYTFSDGKRINSNFVDVRCIVYCFLFWYKQFYFGLDSYQNTTSITYEWRRKSMNETFSMMLLQFIYTQNTIWVPISYLMSFWKKKFENWILFIIAHILTLLSAEMPSNTFTTC